MPTTGPQLRKERRALEITVQAVSAQMGRSRQTIHGWERAASVPPEFASEYRVALLLIRDAREASDAEASAL
jgi:transcriptional regulator with XRE-family HTH domain